MNKIITICFVVLGICTTLYGGFTTAQTNYYGGKDSNVIDIIDNVQKKNPVIHSVFEQKVRTYANADAQWFGKTNRLANGAWILVEAVSPYVQWMVFIGMSMSVILIIYNGFLIVTNAGDDGKIKTAKDNVKNILTGVLVLGGFYFILRIVSGLLLNLIGG